MHIKKATMTMTLVIALVISAMAVIPGFALAKSSSASVTRADLAVQVVQAFKIPTSNASTPFTDIKGISAEKYIKTAYVAKLISANSKFNPKTLAKREDAADMVWRYLISQGVPNNPSVLPTEDKVDKWAKEAVENVVAYNLIGPGEVVFYTGARYRATSSVTSKELTSLINTSKTLLATRAEAKKAGHPIVNDYYGISDAPQVPVKGLEIRSHSASGALSFIVTVTDLLNPVKDGAIKVNDDGTISPANVPVISVKGVAKSGPDADYVRAYGAKISPAAKFVAQLQAQVNDKGDVSITVPKAPKGYYWKLDENNYRFMKNEKLSVQYVEGYGFWVMLDMEGKSGNPERPAYRINFAMKDNKTFIRSVTTLNIN